MIITGALIIYLSVWWIRNFIFGKWTPPEKTKATTEQTIPSITAKNVNTGINTGIIGDHNTVVPKITHHPTPQLLSQIENTLRDKNEAITIMALSSGNSYTFAEELRQEMIKVGYERVGLGTGIIAPVPKDPISLKRIGGTTQIIINIG